MAGDIIHDFGQVSAIHSLGQGTNELSIHPIVSRREIGPFQGIAIFIDTNPTTLIGETCQSALDDARCLEEPMSGGFDVGRDSWTLASNIEIPEQSRVSILRSNLEMFQDGFLTKFDARPNPPIESLLSIKDHP
jgi:hypothetical protein